MRRTRDSASTSPSWKLISHFGFAARLHRDRPIFNRGMDLSLCGAAPAGIRGDEDLFDWVSLRKRGGKKEEDTRVSSNSIPNRMEFSLWRENPNLPFSSRSFCCSSKASLAHLSIRTIEFFDRNF